MFLVILIHLHLSLMTYFRLQGRLWRPDPLNPPKNRYFIVRNEKEELKKSSELNYWSAPVSRECMRIYV